MKACIYIDGFNLFYGVLKGTPYKWLDIKLLCQNLLSKECEIVSINYYTAMVTGSPGKLEKQEAYLRALEAHIPEFRLIKGNHQTVQKLMPLAVPVGEDAKGNIKYERGEMVLIMKREEKQSDVNLAVDMVNDAWLNKYDCALLISNDSDLARPLVVSKQMGKTIGLGTTSKKPAYGLKNIPHFHRHITRHMIKQFQMPDKIEKPGSEPKVFYTKPSDW